MDHLATPDPPRSTPPRFLSFAAFAIGSIGFVLLACALAATQAWLDRHFLPSFLLPRDWYVRIETTARIGVGTVGMLLVLGARPAGRLIGRAPVRVLSTIIAAVLALGASEVVLRRVHLRPTEWLISDEEPLRQPDGRLGWVLVPSRTGRTTVGGRTIDYAIDAARYRVRHVDQPVEPERPTILFTGESVMFGEGLTWEETVPAQVSAQLGVQAANMAVHGYSTDQAYLRLQAELPHFRQPVAVVSLFMTSLFGRNLDDDRPHLGPGLVWRPAEQHGRLISLAGLLVPYRRNETVEDGVTVTREALRAIANLAREHGALPLIVVPQLGPEPPVERQLRRRIVDESGVPYVFVEVDPAWRLAWDRHPNAAAAHLIAAAVANRLRAPAP